MSEVFYLLIVQAALGGFDVLWNHEYRERLPHSAFAALEQKIHAARELLYAGIFFALAYAEWHGWWVIVMAMPLAIELLLTAWDFIVEDRTRKLSAVERTTHLLLSVNGGAYLALLVPQFVHWGSQPTRVLAADYGLLSLALLGFGLAVLGWGIRDLIAGIRLKTDTTVYALNEGGLR
ncbi:hypothetical protein [Methylomarinum vadi]|uniref:hypothetical protein n=1 Tax=Methylomarinum vadi TaxID=438855 RepID=UPI00068D2E66|nr:hypothetical protein [Methylomarinum vadi]